MIGTQQQKALLHAKRHQKRMDQIYAKREDICYRCSFFTDGRFCANPKNATYPSWPESGPPAPGMPMVDATQGCDGFDRRRFEIRPADPEAAAERARYKAERGW